jgi:hypothetical protein
MTTVSSATYKPILTISAVPPVLVRTFKEKDHAREFLAGNIRFGLLQYYREMEDCRKDETEGRASIQWNLGAENPELHNVTYTGTSLEPYYVLCTSDPERKSTSADFGAFRIRINEPLRLLKRICEAWKDDPRACGEAFIVPVLYNKDELVSPPPYLIAPPCLVYAQKHAKHSNEAEYRYVISCGVGVREDSFITLRVGPCDDICCPLFNL